jgi:hypothetical protein
VTTRPIVSLVCNALILSLDHCAIQLNKQSYLFVNSLETCYYGDAFCHGTDSTSLENNTDKQKGRWRTTALSTGLCTDTYEGYTRLGALARLYGRPGGSVRFRATLFDDG